MSDNWVVQNLANSLDTWNEKLGEVWTLLTQSPQAFKGGAVWSVIVNIYGTLQAIGYALLVLFFVAGVIKTCGSFAEVKRPEHALRLFFRFALSKAAITYGMNLMLALLEIVQGIISDIMQSSGIANPEGTVLPSEIVSAVEDRRTDYLGAVLHHDPQCLRQILQDLYLYRHRAHTHVCLCG